MFCEQKHYDFAHGFLSLTGVREALTPEKVLPIVEELSQTHALEYREMMAVKADYPNPWEPIVAKTREEYLNWCAIYEIVKKEHKNEKEDHSL